jgi:hypothetical protein
MMSALLSQPPALIIRLELEAAPSVMQSCMTESEEDRLLEWLGSRPELLRLVTTALKLADEARAA